MTDLIETPTWEAGIRQLETTDRVQGGVSGVDNIAPRQLANRTKFLKDAVDALVAAVSGEISRAEDAEAVLGSALSTLNGLALKTTGSLQDLAVYLEEANVALPCSAVRRVTALQAASPASVDIASDFATSADVKFDIGGTQAAEIQTTNAAASTAKVYVFPLTDALRAHQGKQMTAAYLYFKGANAHAALPVVMPRIAVRRTKYDGSSSVSLAATTWSLDASATTAAYQAFHAIAIDLDQNNTIDLSQYGYDLLLQAEGGTNALAFSRIGGLQLLLRDPEL